MEEQPPPPPPRAVEEEQQQADDDGEGEFAREEILFASVERRSLCAELRLVFPSLPADVDADAAVVAVTTLQRTDVGLTPYGEAQDREKDRCLEAFMAWAARLRAFLGGRWWCDYADPCSGLPVHSAKGNCMHNEVDTVQTLHRFRTEQVGVGDVVCHVLLHPRWGDAVYPATLFTTAPRHVVEAWCAARRPPKTVVFLRHAQAEHNVLMASRERYKEGQALRDPPLTDVGRAQASRTEVPLAPGIVLVSPMRRTLQTALLLPLGDGKRALPLVACPEAAEHHFGPACDTGSPVDALRRTVEGIERVDLSPLLRPEAVEAVEEGKDGGGVWWPAELETEASIAVRGQVLLERAMARDEDVVLVVTHAGLLRRLHKVKVWKNCEARVFKVHAASPLTLACEQVQ